MECIDIIQILGGTGDSQVCGNCSVGGYGHAFTAVEQIRVMLVARLIDRDDACPPAGVAVIGKALQVHGNGISGDGQRHNVDTGLHGSLLLGRLKPAVPVVLQHSVEQIPEEGGLTEFALELTAVCVFGTEIKSRHALCVMPQYVLCVRAEQACDGIKGIFTGLRLGNQALDRVNAQSAQIVRVVGHIHQEWPYLIVIPSVGQGQAQIADVWLKPAGLSGAVVVFAAQIHFPEPVCQRLPPGAGNALIHPCLLVEGHYMTEFMGDGQFVQHGVGTDDLDPVAVLRTHERPAVRVLIQTRIGQVYVGFILLGAVPVHVHI